MNIEVVRPLPCRGTNTFRQLWRFGFHVSWGSSPRLVLEHYAEQYRPARARLWRQDEWFSRLDSRHSISPANVPTIPPDVLAEVKQKIMDSITIEEVLK